MYIHIWNDVLTIYRSLADTLAQAMATRRFEMQEAPSTTSTSNDDDWD
jgi:hypothetical protein